MTIAQVGSATSATSSAGTDVVVTKPTGTTENDVLVAYGASNEGAFDTLPSGFTEFAVSADGDTTNNFRTTAWYKVCGGSEPADYTFGNSTAEAAGAPIVVLMASFRGVDTAAVIDSVSEIAGGTSGEPANPATSFTSTANGRVIFVRSARSTTAIPTFTNGTGGWTELVDDGDFSGATVRYGAAMYLENVDTPPQLQSEPSITCGTTETDNVYILVKLTAGEPSSFDTGTGTDAGESITGTVSGANTADSGTGTDNASVSVPVISSDTGTGTEGASPVITAITEYLVHDDFDRDDEDPLNVSSSGHDWTTE